MKIINNTVIRLECDDKCNGLFHCNMIFQLRFLKIQLEIDIERGTLSCHQYYQNDY